MEQHGRELVHRIGRMERQPPDVGFRNHGAPGRGHDFFADLHRPRRLDHGNGRRQCGATTAAFGLVVGIAYPHRHRFGQHAQLDYSTHGRLPGERWLDGFAAAEYARPGIA